MSRRRRQERRRGRQPLVASRCTLCPGMARLGSARPGRGGGAHAGSRQLRPRSCMGGLGRAHAQRRDGAPAASEPFPRRCPRTKRRRAPTGSGCASRRRRGTGAGLEWGAASQTKIAGEEEEEREEEEEEEEKRDTKYTASGEGGRERKQLPLPFSNRKNRRKRARAKALLEWCCERERVAGEWHWHMSPGCCCSILI
ncbi:uncharacterized protein PRD47_004347 [Ara ararauna]